MSTPLKGRKIILGITGSIAAYKACSLCRLLIKAGADVQVVMTKAATKLVGIATLEALSGHSVPVDIFEDEDKIGHIALARDADLFAIAPASANTIAKIAAGFADNMLTAAALACTCRLVVVPAMNTNMFHNQATQENLATLARRGAFVMQPATGDLACGVKADGRMPEPEEILAVILSLLCPKNVVEQLGYEKQDALPKPAPTPELTRTRLLPRASGAGLKVVITAGPTAEALDPVRFITNKSSGKMGFALAEAARERGAEVTLIAGPVALATPDNIKRIDVRSAVEMLQAVESTIGQCDVFIGCAAVADFRAQQIAPQKIKKNANEDTLTITLVKNPDIVATIGHLQKDRPFTVGFAAETELGEEHAQDKLARKNLDLIALNYVQNKGTGFDSDLNELKIFDADGLAAHFPVQSKKILAGELMDLIFNELSQKSK